MRKLFSLIVAFLLLSFLSCSENKLTHELNRADKIMDSLPDSAYTILKSIPTSELNKNQIGRWAYLYSKTEYKMGLDKVNDSILDLSLSHHKGSGDSLEYQTLLFKGTQQFINQSFDSALVHLHHSNELAVKNNNYYYAGLASRELSLVYYNLLMTPKELEWALKAKENFVKAKKEIHAKWMFPDIIRALERSGRYSEAIAMYNDVDSLYDISPYLTNQLYCQKAQLFYDLKDYDKVISTYDTLKQLSYNMRPYDHFILVRSYLALNNLDKGKLHYKLATEKPLKLNDSLHSLKCLAEIMAMDSNYRAAYQNAMTLVDDVMTVDEARMTNPKTSLLLENYKLSAENEKISSSRKNYIIISLSALCVLILLIIIIVVLYFRSRIVRKRNELDEMEGIVRSLKTDIGRLKERNSELEKSNNGRDITMNRDIWSLMNHQFEFLNEIYDKSFREGHSKDNSKVLNYIAESFRKTHKIDFAKDIEDIINSYQNNWLEKFKEAFPGLSQQSYDLVMYLYLGFSRETIAVLLNKESVENVSSAKYKLKQRLLKRVTVNSQELFDRIF